MLLLKIITSHSYLNYDCNLEENVMTKYIYFLYTNCRLSLMEENIKKKIGDAGYRSPYFSHAKRALYHLSYIPYHTKLIHFTKYKLWTKLANTSRLYLKQWCLRCLKLIVFKVIHFNFDFWLIRNLEWTAFNVVPCFRSPYPLLMLLISFKERQILAKSLLIFSTLFICLRKHSYFL